MIIDLNVRQAAVPGIGLGLAVAGLIMFRDPSLPLATATLGGLIILMGCIPGVILLAQPEGLRATYPLLPLTGLFYAIFFGLPVFMLSFVRNPESGLIVIYRQAGFAEVSAAAQWHVVLGLALLYAAYGAAKRWLPETMGKVYRIPLTGSDPIARYLCWLLAVAHVSYLFIPWIRQLPSVGQFLQPVGFLAIGMFYVLWRQGQLPRADKWALLLVVAPLIIGHHVSTTFLTTLVLVCVLVAALEFWLRGRLPWVPMLGVAVLLVSLYPTFSPIRERVWDPLSDKSIIGKLSIVADVVSDAINDKLPKPDSKLTGFTTRIGHVLVFSEVVKKTPVPVPYWDGETYAPLLTSFIPRAVWPEKPWEVAGLLFGHRYGFLEDDDVTSVNVPWITEMYANFGSWGVGLGMVIVGFLVGLLEAVFCHRSQTDMGVVVGASLCLPVFFQESNFSVMMGSFVPLLICLWIYFRVGERILRPVAPRQ